jgi:hypothetical protein
MSNLHTCTSTTRPAEPSQGDMLFETDSDQLILYYSGDWLSFGSSAQAASTVLNIDISIGSASEIQQYFNVRYLGDWGITTSSASGLANPTPLQIKSGDNIFNYNTPDHDLSLEFFNKQSTIGSVKIGISTETRPENVQFSDANSVAIGVAGTDIITTTETTNSHEDMFVSYGVVNVDPPLVANANNIVMQSDISEVTFDTEYPPGTIINSELEDGSIHIGFAGDPNYGPSKDINNGMLIEPEQYYDREGAKSFVAKTYRDTSNVPVSAGPFVYPHNTGGGVVENNSTNLVTTAWFKLSATNPVIEQGTRRFIFGLPGHSVVQAISASDGSGWYMHLETFIADGVPQSTETKLQEDVWYNVTVSITGNPPAAAGRDVNLYLDGNLIHTTTSNRTIYFRNVGNSGPEVNLTTGQRVLNGMWTGFAAWNQPLTENQIQLISDNTRLDEISVPSPSIWIHPMNDPMKLFGAYDCMGDKNVDIHFNDNTDTSRVSYAYYQSRHGLAAGYESFPQDITIYSEDHPTK